MKTFPTTIRVYCDGGARGNPGPAALGASFPDFQKNYSKFLGKKTNNEAEYEAVIFAFKKVKALVGSEKAVESNLKFYLDSELLVKQLNGEYKVLESKLKFLFVDVWNAKQDFKSVTFTYIPREENTVADELVNKELDSQQAGLFE